MTGTPAAAAASTRAGVGRVQVADDHRRGRAQGVGRGEAAVRGDDRVDPVRPARPGPVQRVARRDVARRDHDDVASAGHR